MWRGIHALLLAYLEFEGATFRSTPLPSDALSFTVFITDYKTKENKLITQTRISFLDPSQPYIEG